MKYYSVFSFKKNFESPSLKLWSRDRGYLNFSDGPRPLHLDSPTSENKSEATRPKPALVSKKSNEVNNLTDQLKKNGQFKKMKKESKKPSKKLEIKKKIIFGDLCRISKQVQFLQPPNLIFCKLKIMKSCLMIILTPTLSGSDIVIAIRMLQ